MEREDGEVGEVGEEVVKQGESSPQPVWPGWQLPAGCGGLSKLRRGFGADDQLPGCLELLARLKNLEEMSQQMVESQG